MNTVLVTGGAGFIGSHACKALANAGFHPIVVDNLSTGHAEAVKWGPLVVGDIADEGLIRRVVRDFDIRQVLHFAASAYVGESISNPRKYFANNVEKSLTLLNAILDEGVTSFVFSSSCATYGVPTRLPLTEDDNQLPISPYGESKLFIERALRWYEGAYGLKWVALRFFNAAGADPDGELKENHEPETHLLPLAIMAALGRIGALTIHGNDYPTPDGTAVRDYVHVSDLADAHVYAAQYLLQGGRSIAVNLGSGQPCSVLGLIDAVQRHCEHRVPVLMGPRRAGDPPALFADATLASSIFGWQPRRSGLKTLVKSAHAALVQGDPDAGGIFQTPAPHALHT